MNTSNENQITEMPEDSEQELILKSIKNGWILATLSGVITAILFLVKINTGLSEQFNYLWLDIILIFALALGIYYKSRFASTFMFIYFTISKITEQLATISIPGLVFGLIFLYIYYKAMVATYKYHKMIKTSYIDIQEKGDDV